MKQRKTAMVFAILLAMVPVSGQADDFPWAEDLKLQAREKKGCEVQYFLNMRETRLAGRKSEEARVQCTDGHRFDAIRTEPSDKFDFHACDIQAC